MSVASCGRPALRVALPESGGSAQSCRLPAGLPRPPARPRARPLPVLSATLALCALVGLLSAPATAAASASVSGSGSAPPPRGSPQHKLAAAVATQLSYAVWDDAGGGTSATRGAAFLARADNQAILAAGYGSGRYAIAQDEYGRPLANRNHIAIANVASGAYIAVNRGSGDPKLLKATFRDWANNVGVGVLGPSVAGSYRPTTALEFTAAVQAAAAAAGGAVVDVVGHSLGGGLAEYVGMRLRLPVTVFGAMLFSDEGTMAAYAANSHQVIKVENRGDPVPALAAARRVLTDAALTPFAVVRRFLTRGAGPAYRPQVHTVDHGEALGGLLPFALDRHDMDAYIAALRAQQP